jgi:hypothetical protein
MSCQCQFRNRKTPIFFNCFIANRRSHCWSRCIYLQTQRRGVHLVWTDRPQRHWKMSRWILSKWRNANYVNCGKFPCEDVWICGKCKPCTTTYIKLERTFRHKRTKPGDLLSPFLHCNKAYNKTDSLATVMKECKLAIEYWDCRDKTCWPTRLMEITRESRTLQTNQKS